VVFFEKYCQYSDLLLLELRLEVGVGVLVQATSLVLAPEDAELTECTKAGVEPPPPKVGYRVMLIVDQVLAERVVQVWRE
jgi:hypothetical protein